MSQTEAQFRLVILRKMCQNAEFFWSIFSRIRTEYGEILRIQSKCGKIRTRKTPKGHFSRSVFSGFYFLYPLKTAFLMSSEGIEREK